MSSSEITNPHIAEEVADKGKGKAAEIVETEDESSDEEIGAGDESAMDLEDADDDDLAEIDTSNIIQGGRRTRGAKIDFKAAQENEMLDDDDDDDDDADFQAPKEEQDDDVMAMDTK
ncbi:histone chaperone domain CHZ-domain-containing protein [Trichophaea hybrida]|nr:histone chaperone domain CHZ-domain-containing protein [Trichophaea hybrida]